MWVIEYQDRHTKEWDICVLDGVTEVFSCKQLATNALAKWKELGEEMEYRISEAYVMVSEEYK